MAGLVASMLLIAAVDLLVPDTFLIPFLAIPVVASALLGDARLTAWIGAVAVALFVVVGLSHGFLVDGGRWLHLAMLLATWAMSIIVAHLIGGWRKRLEDREDEYRLMAENASDIVARVTVDGTLEWISPSVATVLGWEPGPLIGTQPWDLVHPDDRDAVMRSLAEAALSSDEPPRVLARFATADGTYAWLSAASRQSPAGRFIVSFRRVDDEVHAQQALADSEKRYRLLAENAMDMVFSLDTRAIIQWVSPSATVMLGYETQELEGKFGSVLIAPEDLPTLLDASTEARAGRPSACRIRMVRKSGDLRWVEATPRGLYDDMGTLVGGVIGVRDVEMEMEAREALQHELAFDALTGLANRSLAIGRISDILATRGERGWALLCVGVHGMTLINHAYTHVAGDEVLRTVAERLVAAAGATDRVARIAGDEFVVLLSDIVTPTDAASAADRILAAVRGPVDIDDAVVDITGYAGIAVATGTDAEHLLRDATAAMRQAGAKGTDRWDFLDGNVGAETRQALAVEAALREALGAGRIVPWFMPVVSLADGTVQGYEALARWILEDGSVRLPVDFLDVAERTGLVLAIDRIVLGLSLEAVTAMPVGTHVGVNVSAATLSSGTLVEWLRGELDRTGADATRVHLEVTETALFDVTDRVKETMASVAAIGISWWVDDFGTGFSSISHLRDLPVTGLKLDQTFTAGLTLVDNQISQLSQGLVGLAQGLGLSTVAEGVETLEQAQVLAAQGWQMGQGWLFGKAAPLAALRAATVDSAGAAG
ncbi:MAG: EAL domain-containing protein [Actinobacteria bacterium]|nr:EAL domain-containing protein [Actinomycetota bacterium]